MFPKLTIFTVLWSSSTWGCDMYIWNSKTNEGAGKRWCNKSDHPCSGMMCNVLWGFCKYRTDIYPFWLTQVNILILLIWGFLGHTQYIYEFWLTISSFVLKQKLSSQNNYNRHVKHSALRNFLRWRNIKQPFDQSHIFSFHPVPGISTDSCGRLRVSGQIRADSWRVSLCNQDAEQSFTDGNSI